MMRILSGTLALGLIAGFAGTALAQTDGWYVGAEGGVNFVPKLTFSDSNHGWQEKQDTGYAFVGQVGYGFGQVRLEGEVNWRDSDLSQLRLPAYGGSTAHGTIGAHGLMGNAYLDIPTSTALTPFIGVGIGVADVVAGNIRNAAFTVSNTDQFVPAGQAIVGVAYDLSSNLSLKVDYRYLRTTDAHLSESPSYGVGNGRSPYSSQAVMVGFSYKFGAPSVSTRSTATASVAPPPPPPPPAKAPPPPKPVVVAPIATNFQLFFDFDKSAIVPEAQKTVDLAVSAAKAGNRTTIVLTGYTDSVGTVRYNLALSLRRAESVKAALIAQGIPGDEISVVGKGKADQLVPTKDGVREPQNRRVTIVLN